MLAANKELANSKDDDQRTPMHYACRDSTVPVVELLLKNGAYSVMDNGHAIHAACQSDTDAVAKLEVLIGRDPGCISAVDDLGRSPLHHACHYQRADAVQDLVRRGVDTNARSEENELYGTYPLHACFHSDQAGSTLDAAKALLANPLTDVNMKNDFGVTSFFLACYKREYATALLLLDRDADPSIEVKPRDDADKLMAAYSDSISVPAESKTPQGKLQLELHMRLQNKDDEEESESKQAEVLMEVSAKSDPTVLTSVLQHGVDVSVKNDDGETALLKATQGNSKENANICLLWGGDVNSQDKAGNTALHHASKQGNEEVIQLLMSHALIDPQRKNVSGKTPLELAVEAQKESVKAMFHEVMDAPLKQMQLKIQRLEDEKRCLQQDVAATRQEVSADQSKLLQLTQSLRQAENRAKRSEAEIQKLETLTKQIPVLDSNIVKLQNKLKTLGNSEKQRTAVVVTVKTEIEGLQNDIVKLHGENKELLNQVHIIQVQLNKRDSLPQYEGKNLTSKTCPQLSPLEISPLNCCAHVITYIIY